MDTVNKVIEGSISWGTLRVEDLLEAFGRELYRLVPVSSRSLQVEAAELLTTPEEDRDGDWHERADEVLNDMRDNLDNLAPEGMYFGAADGDGSDFGFWRIEPVDDFGDPIEDFGDLDVESNNE